MKPYLPKKPSNLPIYLSRAFVFSAASVWILRTSRFEGQPTYASGLFDTSRTSVYPWVLGFAAVALFLRNWHRRYVQEYLNELANLLLKSPTLAPYWLYLRPFSFDGAMPQRNPGFYSTGRRDFEELLRLAVQRKGRLSLVALGDRKSLQGAGRAEIADSVWQENFQALARSAGWILVIPGGGAVRLEVDFIVQHGILARTIFLMPPAGLEPLTLKVPPKTASERAREHWDEAVREMIELGLKLPDYRKRGMLFTLDGDGNPGRQAVLKSSNPRVLRNALKWITEDPLA